ncbi:MAG: permease [Candidatus Micrarchaeota archaeon]|nr:permease [Candidatus Micrarchaeota archaeon]
MGLLEDFGVWVAASVLGLDGQAAEAMSFFIYDTIKIFTLLAIMVFLVSIMRTFVTPQKIKGWLGGKREGLGNVIAALIGIPTPFCSCSAVPLFIGLVEAGVPLGVTFSFLIASPLINEVAIALLLSLFGLEITILYIALGLAIAICAGIIIGRLGLEKEIDESVFKHKARIKKDEKLSWDDRIEYAKEQVVWITSRVGPYIIFGVGIGALVHGYVPVGILTQIAGPDNIFAVPLAVLVGIPLYSNAAGAIPIIQALIGKGMAMGTALALMMSITALSFPEMIILRKVLSTKLIAIFATILAVSFIAVGVIMNFVLA